MVDSITRPHLKRRATSKSINYIDDDPDSDYMTDSDRQNNSPEEYIAETPKKRKRSKGIPESKPNSVSNSNYSSNSDSSQAIDGSINGSSNSNGSNKKFKYQSFLQDKNTQWNLIPLLPPSYRKTSKFSNVLDLDEAFVDIKAQIVYNTEAILLERDESIYMVSEPPGEPYYIGRIVEFLPKPEFTNEILEAKGKVTKFPARFFNVKMNWYYRPRDIKEDITTFNSRQVYASLHEDICPIHSYRGKCTVVHKDELTDVLPNEREAIMRSNVFYFDSLFDRYTRQYYKVYATGKLLNNFSSIPSFLYALEKKYRYVFAEEDYPFLKVLNKYVFKDYKSDPKNSDHFRDTCDDTNAHDNNEDNKCSKTWDKRCHECHEWCISDNSLECDDCGSTIHLYCMDPPLSKKFRKSIVWICSICVKKQSNSLEDKNLLEMQLQDLKNFNQSCRDTIDKKSAQFISKSFGKGTEKFWFQYVGCHMISYLVDIFDDNVYLPYPFKLSRIGERYQWNGCYKSQMATLPANKSSDNENDSRIRGTDDSAELLWVMDKSKISDTDLDQYIEKCKNDIAPLVDLEPTNCNFLDFITKSLFDNKYDIEKAYLECMKTISRPILHEPTFTAEDIKRFEDAVGKHGSELRPVWKNVGTQSMPMIVRFYYNWKKTERGMKVRGKKKVFNNKKPNRYDHIEKDDNNMTVLRKPSSMETGVVPMLSKNNEIDDIEMRYMDDSSFDTDKVAYMDKTFHCLFCNVDYSPMWYKVTGGSDDKNIKKRIQVGVTEKWSTNKTLKVDKIGALCIRCARLWRRYAVDWIHPLDVLKRMHGGCVSSYNNALGKILEENNINKLTLSPERAKMKNLEWELIQDAELIIRQRWEIMKDYRKFQHMKRQSMTFHGILTRTIRRPYNKYLYTPEKLHADLTSFIAERCDPNFRIPGIEFFGNTPGPQLSTKNNNGDSKDHDAVQHPLNDDNNLKQITHEVIKKTIRQKNERSDIVVTFDTEDIKGFKITVDNKFKSVGLNDKIVDMLLDDSENIPEQIIKQLRKESSSLPVKNDLLNVSLNDYEIPDHYTKFITEKDTFKQLEGYNIMAALQTKAYPNLVTVLQDAVTGYVPKCGVCSEMVSIPSNSITCSNCGITSHKSCYGKLFITAENTDSWLCDVCSNKKNPIISIVYRCCLCYEGSRQLERNVNFISSPNLVLKPTSDGRWCHITCSLFNPIIRYGNPESFEPAINIDKAAWEGCNHQCSICNRNGGGLVQCDKCLEYFHASCALLNKNFKLLFKKELLLDTSTHLDQTIIHDQNDNSKYILSPVIICKKHEAIDTNEVKYLGLTSEIKNGYLISMFSKIFKSERTKHFISSKFNELKFSLKNMENLELSDEHQSKQENVYRIKKQKTCRYCNKSDSIFWYEPDLCHRCHVLRVSGDENVLESSKKSEINTLLHNIPDEVKDNLLKDIDSSVVHLK
ncbi:hypothetical protein RI543_001823 [Arxiozyma heterogenica]|uniref:Uncharacterized protein n=1 Tax=Arxiozyma heterogenica TaxID=278026 RepID=A0AAN8A8T9_9SACH|nr:hypothetical protein RI543_001823 [Kazachstania heterogenica]